MTGRTLAVFLDGERIGILAQSTSGRLSFAYEPSYRTRQAATPLSLSMPIFQTHHRPKVVGAYLAGLLPDSDAALERLGRRYGVSPRNPFALLGYIGRDAAGAVQVLPDGVDSSDAASRQGDIEWLSDDDVQSLLGEIAAHPSDWDPRRDAGRWSLAGAQAKVALFRGRDGRWGIPRDSTPTTHVLKPAPQHLRGHHVNEYVCLSVARRLGLPAAHSELLETGGVDVLVSQRYDRRYENSRWRRIHQEDMCQALSVHPSMKYQSDGGPGISEIAALITRLPRTDRLDSAGRFFDALAFNVAICATDAHAKNYSMLIDGPRATFAPLYDVASYLTYDAEPGAQSAMKIGSTWDMANVTNRDWAAVGRKLGLSEDDALERVDRIRRQLPEMIHQVASEPGIPDNDRAHAQLLADRVDAFVTGHHTTFGRIGTGTSQQRVPRGSPQGGQFAPQQHPESDVQR